MMRLTFITGSAGPPRVVLRKPDAVNVATTVLDDGGRVKICIYGSQYDQPDDAQFFEDG